MSDQQYTPAEAALVTGVALLTGAVVKALEAKVPGLRSRVEEEVAAEVRALQSREADLDAQVLLHAVLRELHNQRLEGMA